MVSGQSSSCEHVISVPTSEEMMRKCKYCKDKFFGVRKCSRCPDHFHKICLQRHNNQSNSPEKHPFFNNSEFKFSQGCGDKPKRCVACYQRDITGYHYVKDDNQTHIHPCCFFNLKPSAINTNAMEFHEHIVAKLLKDNNNNNNAELKIECEISLSPGVKCIICQKKDTESGFGWVYKYTPNSKFECHIGCLKGVINKSLKIKQFEGLPNKIYDRKLYFAELSDKKLKEYVQIAADLGFKEVAPLLLDAFFTATVGVPVITLTRGSSLWEKIMKMEWTKPKARGETTHR